MGIDRPAAARGSSRLPRPGPVPQAACAFAAADAAPAGHEGVLRHLHEGLRRGRRAAVQDGEEGAIDEACKRSAVGKLLPDDLYVHRSALDSLEPLLRIYEGCGRAYLGEVEGANIIKIHRRSGKLSYLVYPDFEDDPHPALLRSVQAEPADAADRVLRITPRAQTRPSCTARSRSCWPRTRATTSSPG